MFRVTMSFAGKPVKKFTFDKELVAIGRDETCDIVVDNIGASRRHATIERTPEGFVLSDLKSHNGTFIAGEKVFHHKLREMDEFQIGKYSFQFEAIEAGQAEEKPQAASALPASPQMTFRLDREEIERIIGHSVRGSAPQLVQIAPEREKRTVVLDRVYYVLGAHPTADVKIAGFLVPARAAVIVRGENGHRILGISSRLRVNGRRVADATLEDGDLVSVGSRRFRFCHG